MSNEEIIARAVAVFVKEVVEPLRRRIEQLESEAVDFKAHLKALKDRKTATAGIAVTGKTQHDVARH